MLIYAGIDEAGYGPLLGPLCVGCSVFVLSEHDHSTQTAPNLWRTLKSAVCRKGTDRRRRIAVEDSKKLKLANDGPAHPLRHLERGVLSFCATGASCPGTDDELYRRLCVSSPASPWYASSTPLPVAHTRDEMKVSTSMLGRALGKAGVTCALVQAEAIDADSFNDLVDRMGSKASVNLCSVMRLVDAVWRRWPEANPHIVVDRQSGRTHYLREIQLCYSDAAIRILDEDQSLSRYQIDHKGSRLTLSFQVEAERNHLPVALASMVAKYVRELLMLRLNRYFQAQMPELKPTAGYNEDARRYLADIEPLIAQLGLDRRRLVRCV